MKRVLVTGANGFIGRFCLPLLLERGYKVHAVSSKSQHHNSDIHWHTQDLTSEPYHRICERVQPTHLLHLGWDTSPGKYWTSAANLEWVRASLSLLQDFAQNGGQRIVTAGSCAEYDWSSGDCSELDTPLVPSTLYGTSKLALGMIQDSFANQKQFSSARGRVFFVYGPNEPKERIVPTVICSLLRGNPALATHGNQIRDFLYVQDVADAFVALLESAVTGPVNIASGIPIMLKELVYKIGSSVGRSDLIRLGAVAPPQNDVPRLVAQVKRLENEVGWRPKFTLDEGLDATIEWWRIHT